MAYSQEFNLGLDPITELTNTGIQAILNSASVSMNDSQVATNVTLGETFSNISAGTEIPLSNNTKIKFVNAFVAGSSNTTNIEFYNGDTAFASWLGGAQTRYVYGAIGGFIDGETGLGYIYLFIKQNNNYNFIFRATNGWGAIAAANFLNANVPISTITSNGGGATHIAKVTGHLSALSNNLSDILIVAGGGGGGMIIDSVAYDGADAGGISGSGTNSANQTTGYAFGQGESGSGVSGGGGGLYGGYKGVS